MSRLVKIAVAATLGLSVAAPPVAVPTFASAQPQSPSLDGEATPAACAPLGFVLSPPALSPPFRAFSVGRHSGRASRSGGGPGGAGTRSCRTGPGRGLCGSKPPDARVRGHLRSDSRPLSRPVRLAAAPARFHLFKTPVAPPWDRRSLSLPLKDRHASSASRDTQSRARLNSGGRIRERIDLHLRGLDTTSESSGEFLWRKGAVLEIAPYRKAASEDARRPIADIPLAELASVVLDNSDLLDQPDPARDLARLLGVERLAAVSRARLDEAIARARRHSRTSEPTA